MALDETALRRLPYERGELSYEAEPMAEASLADLDQIRVNDFRQRYGKRHRRGYWSCAVAGIDCQVMMIRQKVARKQALFIISASGSSRDGEGNAEGRR